MFFHKRLINLFNTFKEIPANSKSKIILFSDCHRGDNSWADDFADNRNIFYHALNHYYKNGFTYIELGDGDELWENKRFSDIRKAHSNIFKLMAKFHNEGRLYLIYGNHDIERKNNKIVEETLYRYYSLGKNRHVELFNGIKAHEGLVLRHNDTNQKIFLIHGHQFDLVNDKFWLAGRFMSRHFWHYLQLFGIKDPTSPAKNIRRRINIEKKIEKWAKNNKQIIIAGHTHRPAFPGPKEPQHFNTGSCVNPRCITGIEIQNGDILLIKWSISTKDDGVLYVEREVLEGPRKLFPRPSDILHE